MTIIEAKKLAEQGKIVIAPNGQEFLPADFDTDDAPWLDELVFGEWTEKREPKSVFLIELEDKKFLSTWYECQNDAPEFLNKGERIVEFVEVIK